jgi:hypothetical protein
MALPKVFIGSSSESKDIATDVGRVLGKVSLVTLWYEAFQPGQMLLPALATAVREYDFGVFVFFPDDESKIRDVKERTVRDNVLFEAGMFLGSLGIGRTFLLDPSSRKVRRPADLAGLITVKLPSTKRNRETALKKALAGIMKAIKDLDRLPHMTIHDEINTLVIELEEREVTFEGELRRLFPIVRQAAKSHPRRWNEFSSPRDLIDKICQKYNTYTANEAYWWLVVTGVFKFHNIETFTSEEGWFWTYSVPFVDISPRGVVLLNEIRAGVL